MPHSTLTEGSVPAPAPLGGGAERHDELVVDGIGVAPGVAIGPAYLYSAGGWQAEREELPEAAVPGEVERFEHAVTRSDRELRKIVTVAHEKLGGTSGRIFDAQLLILQDPAFYDAVREMVAADRVAAGFAVQSVLEDIRERMEASGDHGLRERAADFLDVQNRVLRNLQQGKALSKIDPEHIVVAENLSAADVLLFSRRGVLGVVLDFGGPTSHVSIMARALGVPAVVSLHGLEERVRTGDMVVLDGFAGRVVLRPSPETLERYRAKQARCEALMAGQSSLAAEPAETRDGHRVSLQANVEFREELPMLQEYGAEGVGLFRTEMLFLTQGRALDEEQQFDVYREVVRAAAPHAVTFRLIDLGGDKVLPLARREANPFLGWRGIRILLEKPDLLRPQLRAVLRAAAEGPAKILLPMVSALDEVRQFRRILGSVVAELEAEGAAYAADVPVGIMVEVPSVALLADQFAAEVDFFSVGTNDLTQFTLAVDRGNDLVAHRYRELHPAVLCLIAKAVVAARKAGIPVCLCGEMAGDPRVTPLLVGLGLDALSASPAYLGLVKRVLRAMALPEAQALARDALAMPDAEGVGRLLTRWITEHTPDLAAVVGGAPEGAEAGSLVP